MEPDRVDPPGGERPPPPARRRFEELLRARAERPLHRVPPGTRGRSSTASIARGQAHGPRVRIVCVAGEQRGRARVEMDRAARSRIAEGALATARATTRLVSRATELLRAAVQREQSARREVGPAAVSPPAARLASGAWIPSEPQAGAAAVGETAAPGRTDLESAGRVEQALALVERVEHFVRSGRASLVLTLRGPLAGRMELQRVAAGVISIRLASRQSLPAGELVALRQALEARGLSVRALETAKLTASGEDACSPSP